MVNISIYTQDAGGREIDRFARSNSATSGEPRMTRSRQSSSFMLNNNTVSSQSSVTGYQQGDLSTTIERCKKSTFPPVIKRAPSFDQPILSMRPKRIVASPSKFLTPITKTNPDKAAKK